MAPLEIPGTSINIPYPSGKQQCPNPECRRDFNKPKLRTKGDVVTLHCPWCFHVLETHSQKALMGDNK
jgi:hypothetical protein